jgi:hypothetical protein
MRHATLFALAFVAALIAVASAAVPSCIAPLVETPPDWKAQREQTRKEVRESVERLEKRYRDKPVEGWDGRHKQIYVNATRILGELEGLP